MSDNKAVIRAQLEGVDSIVSGGKKIKGSLEDAASGGNKVAGALRSVGGVLAGVVSDGLRAAGVFQSISLAGAVDSARKLDAITARLGQASGGGGNRLKAQFESLEKSALTSAPAIAGLAQGLTRATYDANGSAAALRGLSVEALATGRDLSEELDLGKSLRNGLGVVGDTTRELGRLRDIAETVGTVGGRLALQDSLSALSPLLATVSTKTDDAKARLEALVAVIGKGLKPEAATQVAAGALSTVKSRALDIERATGKRVLNDNGEVIDPTAALADVKRVADRKFGAKPSDAKRRALISEFGSDLGLAIYRTDYSEVDKLAAKSTQGAGAAVKKTETEAQTYRASAEGKRQAGQVARDAKLRAVGAEVGAVGDKINDTLGPTGSLVLSATGGQVAGAVGKRLLAGGASGSVGSSTLGTIASGGLAAAALPVAALAGVGYLGYRDITSQAPDYEAARVSAAATAQSASAAGLNAVDFRRGQARADRLSELSAGAGGAPIQVDNADVVAAVNSLPAAFAAQLRASPLQVRAPIDPNALKGGN